MAMLSSSLAVRISRMPCSAARLVPCNFATSYWPTMASAAILTIGNELVSGDVENSNGSWLARRLEAVGVDVRLIAIVPDEIEEIATMLREQAARADLVLVTGGLGGTPDDLTREAVAAAFGVEQT